MMREDLERQPPDTLDPTEPLTARSKQAMGFNPFRSRVDHRGDIIIVAAALLVILALVAWAIFG